MSIQAVYCTRRDGLGARLTSLLAAMRVAELLDVEFKFTWTGLSTWAMDFRPVNGHSIAAPDEFFSAEFLDEHLIDHSDAPNIPELSGPGQFTVQDLLDNFNRNGALHIGHNPLETICGPDFPQSTFVMRDCFDRIGFSDSILDVIESAKNVDIAGPMTAVHVRGGDIIYGEWRKRALWTYKGMSLPIAKATIQWALEKGDSIVCFGDDGEVLDYLSAEYGIINGSALSAKFATEAERAMFEMTLMSRAVELIAGTSTFARVAASLDGIPIRQPEQIMSWTEREGACTGDLLINANTYDRFQSAFAYWYLYYDGRQRRSSRANIEWLNKAQEYDPENMLYPLVKAALLYKIEADDEAENVVRYALKRDASRDDAEIFKVLRGGKGYHLREYQPYIRDAWLRGQPFASLLHAVAEHAKGNRRLSRRILRQPAVTDLEPDILSLVPANVARRAEQDRSAAGAEDGAA